MSEDEDDFRMALRKLCQDSLLDAGIMAAIMEEEAAWLRDGDEE